MRSIRMLAVVTGTLALASACGDGGGTPPSDNVAPVANFTAPSCTVNVPCTFTDASTDDVAVTGWSWDFNGDNTPDATTVDAAYTYAAAGPFNVTLTVTDGGGLTSSKTNVVTVASGANVAPVANFTPPSCTVNVPCPFTDASTDDVAVTGWSWDFNGDGTAEATTEDATFTYTAAGTFSVILTVTDGGGLTDVATQPVTVAPPAPLACTLEGTRFVNCFLDITQRASLTVTLTDEDCELGGNQFHIREPLSIRQTVFFNGCNELDGTQYSINDGTGAPAVIEAGTQVQTQFRQGPADPDDPPLGFPAGRLEGTFPTWTIRIDDGGNPTGPGEPDFGDLVLTITATPR